MTLRKNAEITFNPSSDFIRTDRDIQWGIKVTHMDEYKFVSIFYRQVGAMEWQAHLLSDMDWQTGVTNMSVREWFLNKILPVVQKWLDITFLKTGAELDVKLKMAMELDSVIVNNLRVVQNQDNTLTAYLT